jgi:hypothetical protein
MAGLFNNLGQQVPAISQVAGACKYLIQNCLLNPEHSRRDEMDKQSVQPPPARLMESVARYVAESTYPKEEVGGVTPISRCRSVERGWEQEFLVYDSVMVRVYHPDRHVIAQIGKIQAPEDESKEFRPPQNTKTNVRPPFSSPES